MKTREEILKNKGYWIADWQLLLFEELEQFKKKNNFNNTKLAEHFGVSKGYITQILNGDFDHKMSKLIELALAIGKIPVLQFEEIDQYLEDDKLGLSDFPLKDRPIINLQIDGWENLTLSHKKSPVEKVRTKRTNILALAEETYNFNSNSNSSY